MKELLLEDYTRYNRHLILPEIGEEGQRKLKNAKVLIIGTGGLGSPVAMYLAAAGIGTLGILDYDNVEETNLQRQIIHGTKDIGKAKVISAQDKIRDINPLCNIIPLNIKITSENAIDIIKEYDFVIDGTDNFQTRYLINDACVFLGKPNVYGSVYRLEGQASVFNHNNGPCYRCLYPEPPPPGLIPSCAEGGILGVVPGIIGTIQANETIKIILEGGESLSGRLMLFDAWKMKFKELKLEKDPNCPVCGNKKTIEKLIDYEEFCGIKKSKDSLLEISALELKSMVEKNEIFQIIDIREPYELFYIKLPNSKNIPLLELELRKNEIDFSLDAVIVCKSGIRSINAIEILKKLGFKGKLYNLRDGINGWVIL